MAQDNQALKPDNFINKLPAFMGEKEPTSEDATEEEQQLAAMSRSAGWKVLTEYFERIKEDMETLNETAMANGAGFEQIGQNALVISQVKSVLKRIVDKVYDAREASEKQK